MYNAAHRRPDRLYLVHSYRIHHYSYLSSLALFSIYAAEATIPIPEAAWDCSECSYY